jgi:hypothetical protein
MAFNSYSVQCCKEGEVLDQRHDYFSLAWDQRFDTPNARFKDLAYTYFSICQKKWVVWSVATPNTFAESGMWGREHSGFHLPETDKEESDLVWQTYQTNWRLLPGPDRQKPAWKNPLVIKGSIVPSYGIVENEMALNQFEMIHDPYHPEYIGYSF